MLIEHHFVLKVAIMILSTHITAVAMSTEGRPTFVKAAHRRSSSTLHIAARVVTLRTTIAASSTLISKLSSSVSLVFLTKGYATLIK